MWNGPFGWIAVAVFLIIAAITSVVLLNGGPDRSRDAYDFVQGELMNSRRIANTVTIYDNPRTKVVHSPDGFYSVSGLMTPSDPKLAPGVKRSPKGELLFTANVEAVDNGPFKPTEWRLQQIKYETP